MEQESPRRTHNGLRFLISIILLLLVLAVFTFQQRIRDEYYAYQYVPNEDQQQIIKAASFTEQGQFLYEASRAELLDRESFASICNNDREESVVLGCYTAQRIYVFNVDDPRLEGIVEVTAAHEMLHAVYDRLSDRRREELDALLRAELENVTDERVLSTVDAYSELSEQEINNELHSILGTELTAVSSELEKHYSQYLTDRQAVVSLAKSYEQVFLDIESEQQALRSQLEVLAETVETQQTQYNDGVNALNIDIQIFNRQATSGDFSSQSEFDSARDELRRRQEALAVLRNSLNQNIEEYNQKIAQLRDLNGQITSINNSIDANLAPAPTLQ